MMEHKIYATDGTAGVKRCLSGAGQKTALDTLEELIADEIIELYSYNSILYNLFTRMTFEVIYLQLRIFVR